MRDVRFFQNGPFQIHVHHPRSMCTTLDEHPVRPCRALYWQGRHTSSCTSFRADTLSCTATMCLIPRQVVVCEKMACGVSRDLRVEK